MGLLALDRALARSPRTDHRHRLEHGGDLPVDAPRLDRIAALGVVPVATPHFIYSYGDAHPDASQPPLRSLHERGSAMSCSSVAVRRWMRQDRTSPLILLRNMLVPSFVGAFLARNVYSRKVNDV